MAGTGFAAEVLQGFGLGRGYTHIHTVPGRKTLIDVVFASPEPDCVETIRGMSWLLSKSISGQL
jgi:hypothetical protein